MPSLFRFLMVVGMLGGLVAASLYVLAVYFEPTPQLVSKPLYGVKIKHP